MNIDLMSVKMKTLIKYIFGFTFLLLIVSAHSCKKNKNEPTASGTAIRNLLTGSASKVWQLSDGDASKSWAFGSKGWFQYDLSGVGSGIYQLSDCVKNNDHLAFYPDGTYTQSTYTCDVNVTALNKQSGDSGQWGLAPDNVTLNVGVSSYKLISVTATDLIIGEINGTFHYVSVNASPFLTPTQQLTGTFSKTWKISKVTLGGVVQALTPAQAATRLTYTATGILTGAFTDVAFGQPIIGTWNYGQDQSQFVFTFPASGQVTAVNQTCTIEELTETSFIYNYQDTQNHFFTIYLVPQ
jgi:hypothetical protein